MHILDRASAKEGDFWRESTDMEIVTMAGWPSCVAYSRRRPGNPIPNDGNSSPSGDGKDNNVPRMMGRAEVLVAWGPPIKPLVLQPTNWLGPRLRVEMKERLETKDREERVAVMASGLAAGMSLVAGWAFQQPWLVNGVKGLVGV